MTWDEAVRVMEEESFHQSGCGNSAYPCTDECDEMHEALAVLLPVAKAAMAEYKLRELWATDQISGKEWWDSEDLLDEACRKAAEEE